MRRTLSLASIALVAFALLAGVTLNNAPPASAATIAATTTCSNGVDNTGGLGLICEVTVQNTITAGGGSATVTVRECHGAAGDPQALCSTTTSVLTSPVTAVTQCNGSTNGGGATLRCSVDIVNTFVGVSATTLAASVNQCVGSGDGFTVGCVPFPATTTGATITQCNGSANGGTLVGLLCTATGTESSAHLVTVNQCNGSTNGGGGLVICSSSMSNIVVAAATPTPAPTATAAPTAIPPGVTAAPAATATAIPAPGVPLPSTPSFPTPPINLLFPGLPGIPGTPGIPDTSMGAQIVAHVSRIALPALTAVTILAGLLVISAAKRKWDDARS